MAGDGCILLLPPPIHMSAHKKVLPVKATGLGYTTPGQSGNMEPTNILVKCLKKSGGVQE